MKKSIIILAAGYGTRMNSLLPKTLNKIAGKTMIHYIIEASLASHTEEIILVIGEDDLILDQAKKIYPEIKIARQVERLGTGHAAKIGLEQVREDIDVVQILYGDTPFIKPKSLINLTDKLQEFDICFLAFNASNPKGYGRMIIQDNRLIDIIEELDSTQEEKKIKLCNSGIIAAKKTALSSILPLLNNENKKSEYYLTDIVKIGLSRQYLSTITVTHEQEVHGINSKEELAFAEQIKQKYLRKKLLGEGVTLIAPETNYFCDDITIGKDVVIHPHVIFGEKVVIGSNVEILPFSHLAQCQIEDHCIIGPFARIRPGTYLNSHCKIGNFVEIKNSVIGEATKINHLAYVGDSELGKKVNFGAGSITCNFDGEKKHKTIIGDEVLVGANNSLVAPVTIGSQALIGAGGVITENVPAKNLAIARAKQINLVKKEKIS